MLYFILEEDSDQTIIPISKLDVISPGIKKLYLVQ